MFIRETYKKSKGKKQYTQHQLVESIRTPVGPRQHIVLNLGKLTLPKTKWKELANTIECFIKNQPFLFSGDAELESTAQHYAQLIRKERLARKKEQKRDAEDHEKKEPQYEVVDVNSVITNDAKTIGAEHVAQSQMNEYGFKAILRELNFTDTQITYAYMLIIGRMVHPGSERETVRWLQETSGVGELLRSNVKVYDVALHRAAVLLWKNYRHIEQRLCEKARMMFSLKETVILYDLTNTYFEGSKKDSTIAKHGGNSKEKRNDCPLVTLSLTIDEDGFPKQSKVWEGNVSEPKTLEHILDGLKKEGSSLFPHVHITALGYHILAGILKKLRTAGINHSWGTVRNMLATHMRVTTTMNSKDNHILNIRTCTTPTTEQYLIYNALKIKLTPLGRVLEKIPVKSQRCSVEISGQKTITH